MEVTQTLLLAVVCCVLSGIGLHAWPNGNELPESVCWDMKPKSAVGALDMEGHLLMAQNNMPGKKRKVPYYFQLHTNAKTYKPSQDIVVSVVANQTTGSMFYRGIFLQARTVICASNDTVMVGESPLGAWTVVSPPGKPGHLLNTMDCTGSNSKSAVRHRTPAMKINETMSWKAPPQSVGHITFWATIVHQGNIHWEGVHSRILNSPNGGTPPGCGVCAFHASLLTTCLAGFLVLLSTALRI